MERNNITTHSSRTHQNIHSSQLPLKTQIKQEYIPKYRQKLNMHRTKTYQPSFDRLSELTTKQMDRLIQIEKIQTLLNQEKKGIPPIYICSLENQKNKHPHVYKGNFIVKINKIALKRDIKRLRAEQFNENVLTPEQRRKWGLQMQRKNLKFVKNYRVDRKDSKKYKTYEQLQEKSISSISESVSQFQQTLDQKKAYTIGRQTILQRYKYQSSNILSSTRWFNGMSTHYLNFESKQQSNSRISFQQSALPIQQRPIKKRSTTCSKNNTADTFKSRQYNRKINNGKRLNTYGQ